MNQRDAIQDAVITPCTEEFARAAVERFRSEPASVVDLPQRPALAYAGGGDEDDRDDEDRQDDGE